MPQPTGKQNCPKLSALLRAHKDAGEINVERLAEAFVCSESTAYSVLDGSWDEKFRDLAHALGTLPASVGDAMLSCLLARTDYAMPTRQSGSSDFNGDGREDTSDVLAGGILAAEEIATLLREAHAGQLSRLYTEQQGAELLTRVARLRRNMDLIERLVAAVTGSPANSRMRAAV